ncbi:MAG TPA: glycoside hydrolase family 15 protein [Longimicrobiales bacterium]|nr:glycoside hydrolase family 15 protein [Longimicrobiales bacterium]
MSTYEAKPTPASSASRPIEDYAIIGDTHTAGLVSREGSIDWMCLPHFDSGACFAALLGDARHGRWLITPDEPVLETKRRYREGTLVLETEFTTAGGVVRLVDCMPPGESIPNVLRLVEGVSGRVSMRMDLVIRYDYGWIVPWVRSEDGHLLAVGGPDALALHTTVDVHGEELSTVANFAVSAGENAPFVLSWYRSHERPPAPLDVAGLVEDAERWWLDWSSRCTYEGPWREAVITSLVTLKALTFEPSGGIVAAATTSLPESLGGVRNWDYRYCWLRDATFTLYSLMLGGHMKEAHAWRNWLLRAVAGDPSQLQIMYGVTGERRLPEMTLDWLPGYANSAPVRVGNAAARQFQLDIFGEVIDALYQARRMGMQYDETAWSTQRAMLDFLESVWQEPDEGIWEVRGPRRHFTHSKMMAWVAFDRAVKTVEQFGLEGPVDRWRRIRDEIHAQVCDRGFDADKGAFTQAYGSKNLDASVLLMTLVGFLPPTDARVQGTVSAIERDLMEDGLVLRYRTSEADDGLPPGEGVFLACSFWLADNYALMGRTDDACALFEKLLSLRNDVGLLAEEYDTKRGRLLGNFPQAFSHVGLVNTAYNLTPRETAPAQERKKER